MDARQWFREAKFGLMVHWGLYSLPAGEWKGQRMTYIGEWIQSRFRIPNAEYHALARAFNPILFDADEWVRLAQDAGMQYIVVTAKHHEGFALFRSKVSSFNLADATPFGRDAIDELANACARRGMKLGLYYSQDLDWSDPNGGGYLTPANNHGPRDREMMSWTNDWDFPDASAKDYSKCFEEKIKPQVRELLTNYGKIDILWFDFSYSGNKPEAGKEWMKGKGKDDWEAEELIATARRLQPGIIIDNRTEIEQDLWTPEQWQPMAWVRHEQTGELVTWEACQTFSGSWGYYRDEQTWKSPEMLIRMLVNTVAFGGNLLMNVGPTSRGYFDQRAQDALKVYADWMKYNSRSIYGCTMAEPEFKAPADCRLTQSEDGKRLYVHLFAYPFAHLLLPGLAGKVDYAQFLHDGSELLFNEGKMEHFGDALPEASDLLVIRLPAVKPNTPVPVIELFLK